MTTKPKSIPEVVTGRVTVTPQFLAEQFWTTEYGEAAKQGMRLDHTACLPSFCAENVVMDSDEAVAKFYAQGGMYEEIKSLVILTWPQ